MFNENFTQSQLQLDFDRPVSVHAVHERAAFVIDHYAAAYIIRKHDEERGRLPDEIKACIDNNTFDMFAKMGELSGDYHDIQTAFIVLSLWGIKALRLTNTYLHIKTELQSLANHETLDIMTKNEPAVFIPAAKAPKLFNASYESPEELIQEYQSQLNRALPENFNYWRNVCYLAGNHVKI